MPNVLANLGIWFFLEEVSFCHCPSLVHDFALISHFIYKKLDFSYILKEYLFGFGVWDLPEKNLGFRHHVSVVRVARDSA